MNATRRRYAWLVVAGLLVVPLFHLLPQVPRKNTLHYRLAGAGHTVLSLTCHWTAVADPDHTGAVYLNLPREAPDRVAHEIDVPNGQYLLEITVRAQAADRTEAETTHHRRVTLSGGDVTIHL